jgi:hypothetical protein
MSSGQHDDLSASAVVLHATMRFDDLVEPKRPSNMDAQLAS